MVEHTRTLDFKIAFALGLGTMIAAGIFSLSGRAVLEIGSTAVVAFVLAAVVAGITAAAYSEFASIYSENGGGYLFTSRTFEDRDFLTYGIGAALFLGYTGTTAFYLATMDEWFFRFIFPGLSGVLPHGTFGVAAAVLLGTLNARGTEESGAFQLLITAAKVAVLLVFVGGMFSTVGVGTATAEFAGRVQFEPVNTVSIAALAFITFFGFSAIAASAGEIIEPRKTVPRAIAASIVTVTVLYALVIIAMTNVYNVFPEEEAVAILEEGETAMGAVAQQYLPYVVDLFGVEITVGQALIVLGAVFSMVSASNASILAASGIGSLMGRQGHAPRPMARIHPEYGTPFWSVTTATATITGLVVVFITLFSEVGVAPASVGVPGVGVDLPLHVLGLNALTGFATFNLLVPLAVVNATLIYSRRNFPDIERGFRMPGVPFLPVVGIVANLALIGNLPRTGVAVGTAVVLLLLAAYLVWGGAPELEELVEQVVGPTVAVGETPSASAADGDDPPDDGDRYSVLVPVARPDRAPLYVRLAAALARSRDEEPLIRVLTTTEVPDQTPNELVADVAEERTERIAGILAEADLDVEYTVQGHVSRDVAFDILRTARDTRADLVVMGYAEDRPALVEEVELKAPCDVVFVGSEASADRLDVVNVGVGGGPHQEALLSLVDSLGRGGAAVHLINVTPAGGEGTAEDPEETLSALTGVESIQVHNVRAGSVAEGLVSTAAENGGTLLIGASRDRRLRRLVFGSTPDRVIDGARTAGVPVLVYSSTRSVPERLEDFAFPVYQYLRRRLLDRGGAAADPAEST